MSVIRMKNFLQWYSIDQSRHLRYGVESVTALQISQLFWGKWGKGALQAIGRMTYRKNAPEEINIFHINP